MSAPKSYLRSSLVSTKQHLNEAKQPYGDIFNAVKDDVYGPGPKSMWRYGLDVINIPKHVEFAFKLPVDLLDNALAPVAPEENLPNEQPVPALTETATSSQLLTTKAEEADSDAGVGRRTVVAEEQITMTVASNDEEKLLADSKPVVTFKKPIPQSGWRKTARVGINVLRLPHILIRSLTSPIKYFFNPLNELRKSHPKVFAAILISALLITGFVAISVFSGGMPAFMLSIGLAATQAGTAMAAVGWLAWMGLAAAIIVAKLAFVAATFLISGKVLQAIATEATSIDEYLNSNDRLDEVELKQTSLAEGHENIVTLTPEQQAELAGYLEKYNELVKLIPADSNEEKGLANLDDSEKALAGYIADSIKLTSYDASAITTVTLTLKSFVGSRKIPFSLDLVTDQDRLKRIFANLQLIDSVQKAGQEQQHRLAEEIKQRQAKVQKEAEHKRQEEKKRKQEEEAAASAANTTGASEQTQPATNRQEKEEEEDLSLSGSWVFDLSKIDTSNKNNFIPRSVFHGIQGYIDNPEVVDRHWYTDKEITNLLTLLQKAHPQAEMLTPARAASIAKSNADKIDNVITAYMCARVDGTFPGKSFVFIPVNIHDNHWTLLYLQYGLEDESLDVYYFNPDADSSSGIPTDIAKAVKESYPQAKLYNVSLPVQKDGFNCGTWIVWAVECILQGALPASGDDINAKRNLQQYFITEAQYLENLEKQNKSKQAASTTQQRLDQKQVGRAAAAQANQGQTDEKKEQRKAAALRLQGEERGEQQRKRLEEEAQRKAQEEATRRADEKRQQEETGEHQFIDPTNLETHRSSYKDGGVSNKVIGFRELIGSEEDFRNHMKTFVALLRTHESQLVALSKTDIGVLTLPSTHLSNTQESGFLDYVKSYFAPQARINLSDVIGRYEFLANTNLFAGIGDLKEINDNNFGEKLELLYQILTQQEFANYVAKIGVISMTSITFNQVLAAYSSTQVLLTDDQRNKLQRGDYTIMPIQRLMRYAMIIGQIKEFCKNAKQENPLLDAALDVILALVDEINAVKPSSHYDTSVTSTVKFSEKTLQALNEKAAQQKQFEALRAKRPKPQDFKEALKKLNASGSFEKDLLASISLPRQSLSGGNQAETTVDQAKQQISPPPAAAVGRSLSTVLSPEKQQQGPVASTIQQETGANASADPAKRPVSSNTGTQLTEQGTSTTSGNPADPAKLPIAGTPSSALAANPASGTEQQPQGGGTCLVM